MNKLRIRNINWLLNKKIVYVKIWLKKMKDYREIFNF